MTDSLRDQLTAALSPRTHRPLSEAVDAVMAVVQPELDRLTAKSFNAGIAQVLRRCEIAEARAEAAEARVERLTARLDAMVRQWVSDEDDGWALQDALRARAEDAERRIQAALDLHHRIPDDPNPLCAVCLHDLGDGDWWRDRWPCDTARALTGPAPTTPTTEASGE